MWLYEIFPGVQLMVVDFSSESCFRSGEKQNVIGINHCWKGRCPLCPGGCLRPSPPREM